MAEHIYVSNAAGFKTDVELDGEREIIQFHDRCYKTDNDEIASQLDSYLSKRGAGRMFRKVDQQAALELVEQHKKLMSKSGARSGALTASAVNTLMSDSMKQREKELLDNPGLREEFAEGGLELTETVAQPRVQTVNETETAKAESEVESTPPASGIRLSLGKAG